MNVSLMVVDDEKAAREHILRDIAWEKLAVNALYEASDGQEALDRTAAVHPDIVILDIKMPGMSGLDFLKRMQEEPECPQIIALSGYSDFNAAREMLASGLVVEYLLKPASEDSLFEAVYKCIAKLEEKQRISNLKRDLDRARAALMKSAARGTLLLEELENSEELRRFVETLPEPAVRDGSRGHKAALVRDVKTYLKEHFAEHITLEDVAGAAYISPSYLSKIFPEVEGMGFSEYLSRLRIQEAKRLLEDHHKKIYEIAEEVGYRNVKHFLKVFKKIEGKTPSEYRETLLLF